MPFSEFVRPLCRASTVAALIAIAPMLGVERSVAVAPVTESDILRLICTKAGLVGDHCVDAAGYPTPAHNANCSIYPTGGVATGHFLTGRTLFLMSYGSDCDSTEGGNEIVQGPQGALHAGTVVAEQVQGKLVLKKYQPNFALPTNDPAKDCLPIPNDNQSDTLYCISWGEGQGDVVTALRKIDLSYSSGEYFFSDQSIIDGSDQVAQYDAEIVDCSSNVQNFSVGDLKLDEKRRSISVSVDYADQQMIRRACAPNAPRPQTAIMDAPLGYAFLNEKVLTTRYIYDLTTGVLAPALQ